MTTEILTLAPPQIIAGTGPYAIPHPYQNATQFALRAVDAAGGLTTLRVDLDWTIDPPASLIGGGNLTLTPEAAAAHAGKTLYIRRTTLLEQGWAGVSGPREKGLERQLDLIVQGVQDLGTRVAGAPVLPLGSTYSRALPELAAGEILIGNDLGTGFGRGPTVASLLLASGSATAAAASATSSAASAAAAAASAEAALLSAVSASAASSEPPAELLPYLDDPPNIRAHGYRWPIYTFKGGEAERARDFALADFRAPLELALNSGERIWFPRGRFPIRSALPVGAGVRGVEVDADIPIDVECSPAARIVAGECFVGVTGSVIYAKAATRPDSYALEHTPFRWEGGIISSRELAAIHGESGTTGISLLSLFWYVMPLVLGARLDAGFTPPALNADGVSYTIGRGYADQLLDPHACVGLRVENCHMIGGADSGIYDSGHRDRRNILDPFTTTNGSGVVTVAAPGHGLRAGMYVHFSNATAVGGLTIVGQYAVAGTPSVDTFTIGTGIGATASATGGGVVQITTELSDLIEWSMAGSDTVVTGTRFFRCNNPMTSKRNALHTKFMFNKTFQCATGFTHSDIGEANSYGKSAEVAHNQFVETQGTPIRLVGGIGDSAHHNEIRGFAKTVFSAGADFTPISSGNRIGAIECRSTIGARIHDNDIRQPGRWSEGAAPANKQPVGILMRADADQAWQLGAQLSDVHDNRIDGVTIPIFEYAEKATGKNIFHHNQERGGAIISTFAATSKSDKVRSWDPRFAFAGGGSATYDQAFGELWHEGDMLHFSGYIDLATITGALGIVTITGLPTANAQGFAAAVTIAMGFSNLQAGYTERTAQVAPGATAININQVRSDNGATTAMTGDLLSGNTRIAFNGKYRT